jgi:hypothetical protein
LASVGGNAHTRGWGRQQWVSSDMSVFEHYRLNMIAIGADKFMTRVVERQAVLATAARGFQIECSRIECEVAP